MFAEQIQKHFIRFLGSDVGVSFSNPLDPRRFANSASSSDASAHEERANITVLGAQE